MTLVRVIARNKARALRAFFGVMGIALLAQGAATLTKGEAGFKNYWGGFVSAPFASIMGVAMIAITLSPVLRSAGPSVRPRNKEASRATSKRQAKVVHDAEDGDRA